MSSGGRIRGHMAGRLCALLLVLAAGWMTTAAQEKKPLTAILITAQGELTDPYFADSVVLVMNNLGPAPVGIIVNRPTQIPVARLFPDVKRLAPLPDHLYFGGPVDAESVWFLFRAKKPPERAIEAFEGVFISNDRQLLLSLLSRDKPLDGLRIFVGHAGWAPGQLEAEIGEGAWTLQRADADSVFHGKSEHPWPAPQSPKPST